MQRNRRGLVPPQDQDGAAPGWAWVGEAGPEMVRMTGGETVLSHDRSMRLAQAGRVPARGYEAGTSDADRGYSGGEGANAGPPNAGPSGGGAGGAGGGVREARAKDDNVINNQSALAHLDAESRPGYAPGKDDDTRVTDSYMISADHVDSLLTRVANYMTGATQRVAKDPAHPGLWGVQTTWNPASLVPGPIGTAASLLDKTGVVPLGIDMGVTPASFYQNWTAHPTTGSNTDPWVLLQGNQQPSAVPTVPGSWKV